MTSGMSTISHINPSLDFAQDPNTPAEQINAFLELLCKREDGPYVHPCEISFDCGKVRDSWRGTLEDVDKRGLIGEFLKAKHGTKKCWIGFFSAPAANWVGTGNKWKGGDWHCFAAMVVADERQGKHLLIYNNDAKEVVTEASRISSVLWGLEKSLWKKVAERGKYTLCKWSGGQDKQMRC
ncbi:hypothetical protein ColLi_10952 [Colletotrichum liriopes]|uniref:Uncharacterized protein n=1 Tax=Colletotrichum liriopes TaxID=708192 RepID=A0AA37GWG5_9PEZI|nr:hypothetical protein ColLi_10952 [Colletotrichum liriopes]